MKVKINTVIVKTSQKTGKHYQAIVYNDSLEAIATEGNGDFLPFIGQEIEVEESKSQDGKTTFFRLPGTAVPEKKGFAPKNYDLEYRKSAALLAIEKHKVSGQTINTEFFWNTVVEFEKYLRDGSTPGEPANKK